MLLRRVMQHVKDQNWTAVSIDFVIVVVGVFIGIQVSNWNEQRGDRARERQIVTDMLADLEIDRAEFANAIAIAARRVAAANASLQGAGLPPLDFDYVNPNSDEPLNLYDDDLVKTAQSVSLTPETLWTDVVIGFFPTPSTATYDALVGAGDTRIITDRTLVRDIQAYRNRIGAVMLQKLTAIRRDTVNVGVSYGLAPYLPADANEYFRLIQNQSDLAAAIRVSAIFTLFHHGDIHRADLQAATLQTRLRR